MVQAAGERGPSCVFLPPNGFWVNSPTSLADNELYRFIYLNFLDCNKLTSNNKHQRIYGTDKLNPPRGRIKGGNLNEGKGSGLKKEIAKLERIQFRKIREEGVIKGPDLRRKLQAGGMANLGAEILLGDPGASVGGRAGGEERTRQRGRA
jgi:hypothetical protein